MLGKYTTNLKKRMKIKLLRKRNSYKYVWKGEVVNKQW
jgi:hypothetical protein